MHGRDGAVRIYALAIITLVVLVGVTLALSVASARSHTAAARTAVEAVVAGLRQAERAPLPEPEGEPADAAEAAAIGDVVARYLQAIDAQQWEAAWELTHPDARPATMEQWSLLQITRQRPESGMGMAGMYDVTMVFPLLMRGADVELGEVTAEEMSGWAELSIATDVPGRVALRRLDGGWAVDLEASRRIEARQAVTRQLRAFSRDEGDAMRMFESLMMSGGGGTPMSLTDLALMPQMAAEFAIDDLRVAGDTATAVVTATTSFRIAMPLANGDQGWSLAWCQEPVLLEPGESFADVVEGRLAGRSELETCESNMKQLMLGLLMYAQDYDERLPIADRWCSALLPYVRNREIFHCPADDAAFSYAYNYKLSRLPLSEITYPSMTIALYESEIGKGNAFDWPDFPGTSQTDPPRHGERNVYGYADGHVQALPPEVVAQDRDAWRPRREAIEEWGPPGMAPGMGAPVPPVEEPMEGPVME